MRATPSASGTVTILIDNLAEGGLFGEHGFSAWIELAEQRLLFDTGQSGAFANNADELGVDLDRVDHLVLSHGHYDHTGGVPMVVARAPSVAIHLHPAATAPRFALRGGRAKPIGMPEATVAALEEHRAHLRSGTEAESIGPGVGLTGPIPRITSYEDPGGAFFLDAAGTTADPIADDQALWLRTGRGLVVVVGCSHAGLVNTLIHARELSGETRLRAVVGGFHLLEASDTRLNRTVSALHELGPELIVPCHCTGMAATRRLTQAFGSHVVQGKAGATFSFDDTPTDRTTM